MNSIQAAVPNPIAQYEFEGDYTPTFGTVTGTPHDTILTYDGSTIVPPVGIHFTGTVANMSSGSGEGWIELANDDIDAITTSMSVMAWIKFDGSNWSRGIVTRGTDWRLYADSGYNVAFQIADTTPASKVATSADSFPHQEWHHAAGTYDGSTVKIYSDGYLVDSIATTGPIGKGSNPLIFGGMSDGSGGMTAGFEGWLDDVRIYDRALTAEEIREIVIFPEPGTIALLGLGGLLLRKRK